MTRRKWAVIRYAYPATAVYLTVMATVTVILLLTRSSVPCHC